MKGKNKVLVVFFHVLYAIGWPQVRTCDSVSTARSHPNHTTPTAVTDVLEGTTLWSNRNICFTSNLLLRVNKNMRVRFTNNNPLLRNDFQTQTWLSYTASMTKRHAAGACYTITSTPTPIMLSTASHMFTWIWVKLLHNNHSFVVRFFNRPAVSILIFKQVILFRSGWWKCCRWLLKLPSDIYNYNKIWS